MRTCLTTAAALVALCCMTISTASAQSDAATKERLKRQNASERANANPSSRAGQLDAQTSGNSIRASQLIGMNIQNAKGESVGEINDIVLDANSGKVRYAAVTYGGFLGLGDKLFAVPYEAFQCQQDPNDADEHVMMLNVTQQQLEGARGFDQENWPNFADAKFTSELDQRYGVKRNQRMLRNGRVNVDVDRDAIDVDVDRNRDQ